eukprot:1981345-Prymnesium_polylepis.1
MVRRSRNGSRCSMPAVISANAASTGPAIGGWAEPRSARNRSPSAMSARPRLCFSPHASATRSR